jgi:hypothetical protein
MKTKYFLLILMVFPALQGFPQLLKQKPDISLQMGSMFMTTSGYGSGLTSFISPSLGYKISPKFRVNAGISIINTNLNGVTPYYSVSPEQKFSGNFTSAMVYLNGQYLLNSHLTINGSVYKQFNLFDNNPGNPYSNMYEGQGFNVGFSYKPAENFQIDAGIGYSNGYNPYFPDPFRPGYFGR